MGPEWHLPPSLLCSCLVCPCHEKLHHITAQSLAHEQHRDARLAPCHFSCPCFPSFLDSLHGNCGYLRKDQWSWEHPHTCSPTPLQRGSVSLLPGPFLAAAEDWHSPSRAADVQEGSPPAPLSPLRAPQTRGAVSPSPWLSPAPSPIPVGPMPDLDGCLMLPDVWRDGIFTGCSQPAGDPTFQRRFGFLSSSCPKFIPCSISVGVSPSPGTRVPAIEISYPSSSVNTT